jgi:hypothetical protein
VLDCPICDGVGTLIVELEYNPWEGDISPDRCGCVQCGFVVGKEASHISRVLLAEVDRNGSLSLRALAAKLTAEGLPNPAGAAVWTAATVARVKARLAA